MEIKVLWLDDEFDSEALKSTFIRMEKHFRLIKCYTKDEFLDKIESEEWDAIVLDVLDTNGRDSGFQTAVRRILKGYKDEPWFVFSGQENVTKKESDIRAMLAEEDCQREYADILYIKSEHNEKLINDIKNAVSEKSAWQLKNKYSNVLSAFDDNIQGKEQLFDILLTLHGHKHHMSVELRNSSGSVGTCCNITKYAAEIEALINVHSDNIVCGNPEVEDLIEFAMEKHLEDFLIKNWKNTPLGAKYNIYEVDGELVGEQYPSDTGPIDILAISKDKRTLLVIELKKGRASDVVVGQIQRYMGYVKEELAEANQVVKGVIIGLEADARLKRALAVTHNIEFYRYQIDFKLLK